MNELIRTIHDLGKILEMGFYFLGLVWLVTTIINLIMRNKTITIKRGKD